jgi:hypothetical protein
MRFRLRTLLIVLAVGPLVLAGAWWARAWIVAQREPEWKWRMYEPDGIHYREGPNYDKLLTDPDQKASPLP